MRGRTIGKVSTSIEQGPPNEAGSPAFAAVGTNVLNDFNIVRATIGLYQYVSAYLAELASLTVRVSSSHTTCGISPILPWRPRPEQAGWTGIDF